ncbi:discoidin domain-containing protein [Paenibacillus sp. MMS20-IR301]|uniref:discoidin domain-containing protein n=1 Tax=Paenibacillus sp. MMS20-IR301 TaxID=2895946 RepID=UPI0028E735F6|nr:discoidin domain-containing protein [Paenibacillus sp. MMS20-IR301]WNS43142.1 discoidin domain-containing protein [Paenibacillus sp. MMS20-IR301]
MKKVVTLVLSLILLSSVLITAGPAQIANAAGTTYYVDSAGGNDSNSGTSTAAAWKSLTKVNATTFQPGDQILFKSGGVWNGQLWPKGSGSAGLPIKIDLYGGTVRPIINGGGTQRDYQATGAVMLRNQQYWEISNLEVTNDDNFNTDLTAVTYANSKPSNIRDGILVVLDTSQIAAGADTIMDHIYIHDNYVHDVDSPNVWPNQYGNASFNGGIIFYVIGSLQANMTFNDVRIENNTIEKVDLLAIANFNYTTPSAFQDEIDPYNLWQTNIYIGHNYMRNIGQGAIDICDAKNVVVEYNVVDGWSRRYNAESAGIYPWKSYNVTFQNNEVYGGPTTTGANNGDGTAFDFDSPNINIVYQFNYTHNNPMGWMSYLGRSSNNIARYNISDDNAAYLIKFGWFDVDTSPTYFLNNVFIYDGAVTKFTSSNANLASTYFKSVPYYFYNNVFYDKNKPSSSFWPSSPSSYGTAVFRNNAFYVANGSHAAGEPSDAAKVILPPQMVNPGAAPAAGANGYTSGATVWNGYKLQDTSPLINAGLYVSQLGTKDFYGNTLYNGAAPDIGVFESTVAGGSTDPVSLTAGGTVTASSTSSPSGEEKEKAFDANPSTKWLITVSTGWIQYKFAAGVTWAATSYSITSANDVPGRDPKSWTLQGSNNGTSWTNLDTRTNETFATRFLKKTYTFSNTTAYAYYRLNISANNGETNLQLAEIGLYN